MAFIASLFAGTPHPPRRRSDSTLEPLTHLDRVASRLNRLALQRAAYRTVGVALMCVALLAPAALWLPSGAFLTSVVAAAVLCLGVGIVSFWHLRRRWAARVDAAHWVEHEIDLDERLLTLVTAPDEARTTGLWPELEADNDHHLATWGDHRLGIPRVPGNVLLLVVGLAAAILALAPGGGDPNQPPPVPSFLPPPEEEPQRSGAVPVPGTAEAEGALSGAGVAEEDGVGGSTDGTLTRVKAQLGRQFARSFAARSLGGGTQKEEDDGEAATDMRGDLPESDLGDSVSQDGGMTPPEGMGHIVQDDADDDGQTVRRFESEGGDGTTGSSQGGVRTGEAPEQGDATGGPAGGEEGDPTERDPDAPVMVSEDASKVVPGTGGSGPGDQPGTGPLLAKSPLDLSGGRRVARFSLALGAMSDAEGGEGGTLESDVYSHIAEGERGEQEADRGVRHESIPPEYETVIKRVFERNT